jgi:hypothetical protein
MKRPQPPVMILPYDRRGRRMTVLYAPGVYPAIKKMLRKLRRLRRRR